MTSTRLAALWGSGALVVAVVGTSAVLLQPSSVAGEPPGWELGGGVTLARPEAARDKGGNPGHPLTLTGSAVGRVRPGSPTVLEVTIRNDSNQAIVVTEVTGAVTSVSAVTPPGLPACDKEWFRVGSFSGNHRIARNDQGIVALSLSLDDLSSTNQDACQSSTLQLRFTAQARQA